MPCTWATTPGWPVSRSNFSPLKTFRLVIAYDGTDFHGWQIQPDLRTVQDEIEKAVRHMTGETVRIQGAGRTDAGVHALGQAASFRADIAIPLPKLRKGLDALTPDDIAILEAADAPEGFNARRDAVEKLYRYHLHVSKVGHPLRRRTHLHVRYRLHVPSMREAALLFVGRHDFAAFYAVDDEPVSTLLPLNAVDIIEKADDEILIEVRGPAFLKNMVRIIAGTLLEVGRGRLRPDDIPEILAARDRSLAGPTLPPHGLTLVSVTYPPEWIRPTRSREIP